jgi:chromosome segregation ATPase
VKNEKCGVFGTIKFEVSVGTTKNAKTGLDIFVVDASGNYTKDNTSKISFEIAGVLSESEKAELNNRISQLATNLNASNSEVAQLRNQNQSLNNTIEKQKVIISKKDKKIEQLRRDKTHFSKDITDLNNQLTQKDKQNERLRKQLDALNKRINLLEHPPEKEVRIK